MTEPQNDERPPSPGDFLCRVHADLRRSLAIIRGQFDDAAADPVPRPELRAGLTTGCLQMCDLLTRHHLHEDDDFGRLEAYFPQLAPAIRRLRAEHEDVAGALADLRALLARFEVGEVGADRIRDDVVRLTTALQAHFDYEEAQLVPVLNAAAT
ncbi:hypothetical protein UO65_1338 [Actinokineospora spheciospongiae]|uniref:Hemerythrin-like domain-containing protein n=1 Tax=Actinokineospora spheciospongiae TaxID=909613 RepID=W7IR06_9PSEU|nr:hemerythrin domain-containing protein [Actinokineospora spheciospongiae]EWC63340.1 hypothetical protein UO65_1338 [Actinokineospora spheciospongiae]